MVESTVILKFTTYHTIASRFSTFTLLGAARHFSNSHRVSYYCLWW